MQASELDSKEIFRIKLEIEKDTLTCIFDQVYRLFETLYQTNLQFRVSMNKFSIEAVVEISEMDRRASMHEDFKLPKIITKI